MTEPADTAPVQTDGKTDMEQLRELIVGPESIVLERLREHFDDPDLRAADIADVLEDAIRKSHADGADLASAIEEPVQVCIKRSIEKDTRFFADALFPVMGPAIRKAITESLKGLVQTINATVENSVSLKSMKWRLEAKRTGVSFGEVILKHTLVYRVEQVLLVQRGTGLLMQHIARDDTPQKDGDAVSAMLTAIQDFVRDSFRDEDETEGGDLASVDIGDQTVWLLSAGSVTMACVIRGIAPVELRGRLQSVLENILRNYAAQIDAFDGDKSDLEPAIPMLEACFDFEKRQHEAEEEDSSSVVLAMFKAPLFYIGLVVFCVFTWFSWGEYQQVKKRQNLLAAFEQEPGMVVTESRWLERPAFYKPKSLKVSGLRDPGSRQPEQVARDAGWTDGLEYQWTPYQSLEADLVFKRMQGIMQAPETVNLEMQGAVLKVSGVASEEWINYWRSQRVLLAGVSRLDLSAVDSDLAPLQMEFTELQSRFNGFELFFSDETVVADSFDEHLDTLAAGLARVQVLSDVLERKLSVVVTAYSDSVGGDQLNRDVRKKRTAQVVALLREAGLSGVEFVEVDGGVVDQGKDFDPEQRKVTIHFLNQDRAGGQ